MAAAVDGASVSVGAGESVGVAEPMERLGASVTRLTVLEGDSVGKEVGLVEVDSVGKEVGLVEGGSVGVEEGVRS